MPDPADTGKNIKTTGTNVASEVNAGAGAKTLFLNPLDQHFVAGVVRGHAIFFSAADW